ncbi:c-type cytochrome [Celeribacter baekdonensis]|uniref:Cytochrome C n=1 Tax=Celeribacter baekdonensis TaxID=875171 RepID=A0A2R4M007_9RHOB|nr:c-type cytochrome [Celeribacter baekdonensis]AVW90447.1 cytochrome C [Celeribacter baekdonensis]|tara:strand:+ start:248727 stop:249137 length:411 start_codon:yes stop_codon:yes gene_type:complete
MKAIRFSPRFAIALIPAVFATTLGASAVAGEYDAIKTAAGAEFFDKECHRCHSVDADRASYGPLLTGVIGRKAGSFEGYPYSEALKSANFTWTAGAIRAWMEDNDGLVPGTKMRHVGVDDATVQDFIVTYLASISE